MTRATSFPPTIELGPVGAFRPRERGGSSGILVVLVTILVLAFAFWFVALREPAQEVGSGEPLVLYCAAGIKPPVEAAAQRYHAEYGVSIHTQYEGSGTLLSKIGVVRRGDLYLAADDSYIEMARQKGLLAEAIPLAQLRPVIAVRAGNPRGVLGIEDLLEKDELRLAFANPDAAAIGKSVRAILRSTGQWDALERCVKVFKPTVSDVANDIKIGAADVGIVWDATANQYDELEIVRVPAFESDVRTVTIGVLADSQQPTAALRFARYLAARDRGLPEFEKRGYTPVEGDVWAEVPEVVLFSGGVNRLAIEDTVRAFEEREGVRVTRLYNGCGVLVGQMKAGEIPDAYFACDISFMTNVGENFRDPIDVSRTDMVILVARGNPRGIDGLAALAKPGLRLGVANAEQSALGALTKRLLSRAGILDAVMANVMSQTPTADLLVNQIVTGSLDAVIVYEANCSKVLDSMEVVRIADDTASAVQPVAVSQQTDHRFLMERLVDALTSSASKKRFEAVGFRWLLETKRERLEAAEPTQN